MSAAGGRKATGADSVDPPDATDWLAPATPPRGCPDPSDGSNNHTRENPEGEEVLYFILNNLERPRELGAQDC